MAEEAAKERSECICVAISLASLTVAFGGLLALVIYQHSKEVRQENLHGRYYLGSDAAYAGGDGGGRWSAEEGVHRDAGIRKDPPPLPPPSLAYPYEPTAQSSKSGAREAPERRLEAEAAGDASATDSGVANGGSHGSVGSRSRLLDEIEKRVADALGRAAAERGPLTNRLLLDLLVRTPAGRRGQLLVDAASSVASVSAPRGTTERARTTTARDGRAARTVAAAAQRSSPRPTTAAAAAAATSLTTDGRSAIATLPPSPSARAVNASNSTAPAAVGSGRGIASAAIVFVWQSVAGALQQPVELRWLLLAVAVAAMGALAFSAVVAAAAVAGRYRDDRSREFSAPAWWCGERPTAAAAAASGGGGGRRRRGHEDWLSLLQSSDDEDDDEVNGDKDEARCFSQAAADGRATGQGRQWRERWRRRRGSPPPPPSERRDAASEVRAYVQRLRALDSLNDVDDDDDDAAPQGGGRGVMRSKESTPLAGCARSYEALASRQRAEQMEWRAGASAIK